MTEPVKQPGRLRMMWEFRPRIIKVMRGDGRPASMTLDQWRASPRSRMYPVWIVAWGGHWRWEITRSER